LGEMIGCRFRTAVQKDNLFSRQTFLGCAIGLNFWFLYQKNYQNCFKSVK
jgi:hypothetical protein